MSQRVRKNDKDHKEFVVLLADPDQAVQQQLMEILQEHEFDILLASDAARAVTYFSQKTRIDAVVADLLLPGFQGMSILRAARSSGRTRRTPFIICSEISEASAVRSALEAGAADFIVKPVRAELLLGKLRAAIQKTHAHVLLVDDNPVLLDILSRVVQREGYSTVTARSAEAALDVVAKERICAIISDIVMPNMNGLELLVAVKEKQPNLPVILITGHGSEFTREQVIAAGADGYISKPFKNVEIATRLAVLIT